MKTETDTKQDQAKERYAIGEGPECPNCGECITADEAHFYDESGFELTCWECKAEFHVQPYTTTTWTTRITQPANQPTDATL